MKYPGRATSLTERVRWVTWLVLVLCIPFTSSPLIANVFGDTSVGPLAILPVLILLIISVVPHIIRKGRWPRISAPLWLFAFVSLLSGILAFSKPIYSTGVKSVLSSTLIGMLTLGLGLSYYFSAVLIVRSQERIKRSVQIIYLGLVLVLVWSTVQATYVLSEGRRVPLVLNNIHHLFSFRDLIYNRVVGWAYEPSWLGNQLVIFFIPLLLGSVLTRFSVFSTKRTFISVELALLTWSLAILALTQSRISYLSLFFVVSLLVVALIWRLICKLINQAVFRSGMLVKTMRIGIMGTVIIGLAASLLGLLAIISRVDKRMGRLASIVDQIPVFRALYLDEAIYEAANRLAFAERIIYWETSLQIFEQHPVFGVGLGNNGFYFKDYMPTYGYSLEEMRHVVDSETNLLPNPKNLWIRLLSETGIVGFSVFIVWLLLTGLKAFNLSKRVEHIYVMVGVSGLIGLAAQVVEGFSLDTFALPQFWILPALIAAAGWRVDQGG
jgi:O-antigen ligase